ncbi:hypothetical protein GCM10027160_14290 [Streptomyces calidiresistens]|uniref:Uncharacterized protein n=1 Tax=Streptomyces calidiresistens TaxID=1485586 RepID=A0A7W3T534_9ACTN|nr:hypothetical protein [Streptomyces calidiresistens]MBB0231105.1 hypothetical protein [Streptomyces calidiresistens]
MATTTFPHRRHRPASGATALGTEGAGRPARHRHPVGDTLRAVRVFLVTAAEVALLGRVDRESPAADRRRTGPPGHDPAASAAPADPDGTEPPGGPTAGIPHRA